MKNNRRHRRIQLWAFSRHFWMHRRENLFVLIILAMGFLFYNIYGTWSAATASTEEVDVRPLELPAGVVAQVPHWVTKLQVTSPSDVFDMAYLRRETYRRWREVHRTYPKTFQPPVDEVLGILEVPVLSACGSVSAWGLPDPSSRILDSFPLVAGRWPAKPGEVAIYSSFGEAVGRGVGTEVTLQYVRMPEYQLAETSASVVGLFEGQYDIMPEVVVVDRQLQELTNIVEPNLFLAWGKEVPDMVITSPPPGSTVEVYRTPPLEELVGTGLEPIRMPVMLGYDPPGGLFPFGMTINDRVRVNGGFEQGLRPLFEGTAIRIWPLMLLIFMSQGIALTVVLAIVVVDRQRTLGVYKVLGVDKGQLRQMYFLQLFIVGLAATVVGGLLFFVLRPLLMVQLGLSLAIQPGTMVLWLFAILVFATWAGHVAASLFATTDIDSLLKVAFNFDWWSIVRIGISPTSTAEEATG